MFAWLTHSHMNGGMVFGRPGWHPHRVEETFDRPADPAPPQTSADVSPPQPPADKATLSAFLKRIRLGPASDIFPGLDAQLQSLASPIKALIVPLLPTQPEFALPAALCQIAAPDIHAGLTLIQSILQPRRTLIVLDRHDFILRRQWRQMPAVRSGSIKISRLLNRYPQSHPVILLRTLFRASIPVGALPSTFGYVVVDPVSCWAIGRALRTGHPFTDRPVQLFLQDAARHAARLVLARIGESVGELCDRFQLPIENRQIILNGILAGRRVDLSEPIAGNTESVALRDAPAIEPPSPCVSCGWCVDVCPTGLVPVRLMNLAQRLNTTAPLPTREVHESLHCIGCNLCSYVCPSRLPLAPETLHLRAAIASIPDSASSMTPPPEANKK